MYLPAFPLLLFWLLLSTGRGGNRKHCGSDGRIAVAIIINILGGVAGTQVGTRFQQAIFFEHLP